MAAARAARSALVRPGISSFEPAELEWPQPVGPRNIASANAMSDGMRWVLTVGFLSSRNFARRIAIVTSLSRAWEPCCCGGRQSSRLC